MENNVIPRQAQIPDATYRWQFNHLFTLRQAAELVAYLYELGISDCYASPLLASRPGSLHGYDVTDHTRLNPELGSKEDFAAFARELKQRGMGLILDVVPNHMCIAGAGNQWWEDILEDGPGSPFARYLDIDWNPPKTNLRNKVLLPTLGDQYGRVLENQDIRLVQRRGKFVVQCYDFYLPLAPETTIPVLRLVRKLAGASLDESALPLLELESIITALEHLPARMPHDREKLKERLREKEIIKRRLSVLIKQNRKIKQALDEALQIYNGKKNQPDSFDQLEALLAQQSYRLCYWRVAADEINYRRFFDINELAAIRVEEPAVFAEVHELIFNLMRTGGVTGLRIDHIDGLFDPAGYLQSLRRGALKALRHAEDSPTLSRQSRRSKERPCYVVVEKILEHEERLRANWQADGTTGYDFLNLVNGVLVETQSARIFQRLYERFTGLTVDFKDVVYRCKKLILRVAMSSELHVLSRRLDRISEQHRYSRDFTLNSLQYALGEVIACFPVYRTYIRPGDTEVGADDRRVITNALREARRRNPALSPSLFNFIGSLLLLDDPPNLSEKQVAERREFVLRFQQLTGPVMAKGVEDTAFYRWFPLVSLNEVGGDPTHFGVSLAEFHRRNAERARDWPHTMLATATHDTKRGEDVRARLNVLSEIPGRWYRAIRRWQQINRARREQLAEPGQVPIFPNEEYLIYQTLVGTWPFEAEADKVDDNYIARIEEYIVKAVREAKIHSSWLNPNEEYETELKNYVRALLIPGSDFLRDFCEFQAGIARAGVFNSLAQTLLKTTAPGVPDFYQGSELWDLNLVDPDNRRPVDYAHRRKLLAELNAAVSIESGSDALGQFVDELVRTAEDGRIKLYLMNRALCLRRARRAVFLQGEYTPLAASGALSNHVVAFARGTGEQQIIVVTGRYFTRLMSDGAPVGDVWAGNTLALSDEQAGRYRDVLTGQQFYAKQGETGWGLSLDEVFAHLPVALLERVN
jgi:(1->4)-alpha-D-glucan 1-alpha-D-glucosylmutase